MKYLIIFYVVPAVIAAYYEVKEWLWQRKRHMVSSAGIKRIAFRVLFPVLNLLIAILYVLYDIKLYLSKKKRNRL